MKRILVKFDQADQIINFVRIMNRFECDADVKWGSRMVDAKSIVGVLSLAKSKTVELILHTDDCDQLMEEIAPFAAQSDNRYTFLDFYMNHEPGQQQVCCGPVLFCDAAVKEMGQRAGAIVMPYGGTTVPVLAGK